MKIAKWHSGVSGLALFLLFALLSGCGASFQAGGGIAQGRQAMFAGDNQSALSDFQSAAQADPNYIYGDELRAGVLSYVGRAQYLTGQYPLARQTLEKNLAQRADDNLARLYLGLTLARSRARGARNGSGDEGDSGFHK